MWFWINLCVLFYLLFVVLEEATYYFWNRYVYGPKEKRPRVWINRIALGLIFLMRLRKRELEHKHTHNMSS